jgi:2-oxoglutarate ferredoxin oxidoreductase subunit delta
MFRGEPSGDDKIKMTAKSKSTAGKDAAKKKKSYTPVIIPAWCKSCGICSAFCPKKVIGLNDMGTPVIERPDECIGCRFCELHCPDFAITVRERDQGKKGNQP